MLTINNLSKSYFGGNQSQLVLDNIDFSMQAGTSVALLGESGSGKSTFLHMIAGLDKPEQGQIRFNSRDIHRASEAELAEMRRSELSLVFQQFHLIATLSVLDNIRFQAALCNRYDSDYEQQLISSLGLTGHLQKSPQQLSRGQHRRIRQASDP